MGEAVDIPALVALTRADIGAGQALSDASGWNQTAADWAVFIDEGRAIGFRSADGNLVASAAALPYGGGCGWVSMVLVIPAWRHRGLASRMVDHCVRYLQTVHSTPVLDATALGAPVYSKRGFQPTFGFERWERRTELGAEGSAEAKRKAEHVLIGTPSDLDAVVRLDKAATGMGRRALLENFIARPASRLWLSGDGGGFVLTRAGSRAAQIGPLVAPNATTAIELLSVAIGSTMGPLFLDVPQRWAELASWLEGHDFVRQRSFLRMALGAPAPPVCSDLMFVLAGPEFG